MRDNALTHPEQAYWNLHNKKWSVVDRKTGHVSGHFTEVMMVDVKFVVQKAGNARTRREKRKNVHAFVRGSVCGKDSSIAAMAKLAPRLMEGPWTLIRYNPYEHTSFMAVTDEGEKPIASAHVVKMDKDRRLWATGIQ